MWVRRSTLACLLLASLGFAAAEEELVWSSRTRSRPRLTQAELSANDASEQFYGTAFVPGHVGEVAEAEETVPGEGELVGREEGGESAAQDARKKEANNIRKQYVPLGGPAGNGLVSTGVGGYGNFGGGAGLAGVGPVIPGGAPAGFGGTASHVACGGRPCAPPPVYPVAAPPPPPPPRPVLVQEPAVAFAQVQSVGAYASCPGGKSLEVECDAKRPWPQCPPQSYCYATNSADVGPYVCCPIWSTYGSKWRPRSAFYPYYPPMPYNWPPQIQATAGWPRQVAPAVAVPVPVPCAAPPCAGGPAAFGPYKKRTKKVLRKVLKGKKVQRLLSSRRTKAKAVSKTN